MDNVSKIQLFIDTVCGDSQKISVGILSDGRLIAQRTVNAQRKQAEKLLLLVDKLLSGHGFGLSDIGSIRVENRGGTFTALRIGIVTANALGYALGVPVGGVEDIGFAGSRAGDFSVVIPAYSGEPNITAKKKIVS